MNQANLVENVEEKLKLENLVKSGAGWFITVGVLSMINTIIIAIGGEINFILGLGITQIVQGMLIGIEQELNTNLMALTIIVNLVLSSVFIMIGVFARKRREWAFVLGVVLYIFDSLLFLLFQDWLPFIFHLFAVIGMYKGYKTLKELQKLNVLDYSNSDDQDELVRCDS